MTQDNKESPLDKPLGSPGRTSKKDVDLFPALVDRKSLPMVAPRPSALGTQISMFTPLSFDDALDIVECLRSRASITLCLEKMRKIDAVRLVDFITGASAAIDGDSHRLSEQVYLFCPSNVKITVPAAAVTAKATTSPLDFLYSEGTFGKGNSSGLWTKN